MLRIIFHESGSSSNGIRKISGNLLPEHEIGTIATILDALLDNYLYKLDNNRSNIIYPDIGCICRVVQEF